jgi:hypothetical protein
MNRKVIQILNERETSEFYRYVIALCDDGTMWQFSQGEWFLIQNQVPQGHVDQYKRT